MTQIELSSFYLDDPHFRIMILRCHTVVEHEIPLNFPKGEDGRSRKAVKIKALVPKKSRCKKRWKRRKEAKKKGRNINEGFL